MFGFFRNRKLINNVSNDVGPEIHSQILSALKKKDKVFTNQEEIGYLVGYLKIFVMYALSGNFIADSGVQEKCIKRICEGVHPGHLWNVFQRGDATFQLSLGGGARVPEFRKAYNLGQEEGEKDAEKFYNEEVSPQKLKQYLLREIKNG